MKQTPDLDLVQAAMQPGVITRDGFLGDDRRKLVEILIEDDAQVARMGLSHERIAQRMRELRERGCAGLGETVALDGDTGVRVDSGVRQGDEVSMHYDPMIAKLSVHGEDRPAAIDRAIGALRDYAILGITTNAEYLADILDHGEFRSGRTHTGFLPEHLPSWSAGSSHFTDPVGSTAAVVAAALHEWLAPGGSVAGADGIPGTAAESAVRGPWDRLGRFRLRGLS